MKAFTFETSCVDAKGEDIDAMTQHPDRKEVTYETMLRHCDGLVEWAVTKGFEKRRNIGSGITLKSAPYVAYYKSVYCGQPCYYLVWSAIEWIWTKERVDPTKGNCYSVAADHLINLKILDPKALPEWVLCHGTVVVPSGPNKGMRHGHAWLEHRPPGTIGDGGFGVTCVDMWRHMLRIKELQRQMEKN